MLSKITQRFAVHFIFISALVAAFFLTGCDLSGKVQVIPETQTAADDTQVREDKTQMMEESVKSVEGAEQEMSGEMVEVERGKEGIPESNVDKAEEEVSEEIPTDQEEAERVGSDPLDQVDEAEEKEDVAEEKLYYVGQQPYTPEAFAQAQANGETMVVDVFASWCEVCQGNKPKLTQVLSEVNNAEGEVVLFTVSYDTDRDFLTAHGVPLQATYLIFEGEQELRRVSGPMTEKAFKAFIG